jgi:hypothetical protein
MSGVDAFCIFLEEGVGARVSAGNLTKDGAIREF